MAPGVRFIDFEIVATGVFFFECALRSLTCSLDQEIRLVFLFVFLRVIAMDFDSCLNALCISNFFPQITISSRSISKSAISIPNDILTVFKAAAV
jgi:hypothetical protein